MYVERTQQRIFYIDEAIATRSVNNENQVAIGSAIGFWDGTDYHFSSEEIWIIAAYNDIFLEDKRRYWREVGRQMATLLTSNFLEYNPRKIFICEKIGHHILRALSTRTFEDKYGSNNIRKLLSKIQLINGNHEPHLEYHYGVKEDVGDVVVIDLLELLKSHQNLMT